MAKSTSLISPLHASTVARGGYICSGHVLINYERQVRKLPSLKRSRELDLVARNKAEQLARQLAVWSPIPMLLSCESSPTSTASIYTLGKVMTGEDLKRKLMAGDGPPGRRSSGPVSGTVVAENIAFGQSICVQQLHLNAMKPSMKADGKAVHRDFKRNLLSKIFTEVGVGTAKGEDGSLFMVQLFRGHPPPQQQEQELQEQQQEQEQRPSSPPPRRRRRKSLGPKTVEDGGNPSTQHEQELQRRRRRKSLGTKVAEDPALPLLQRQEQEQEQQQQQQEQQQLLRRRRKSLGTKPVEDRTHPSPRRRRPKSLGSRASEDPAHPLPQRHEQEQEPERRKIMSTKTVEDRTHLAPKRTFTSTAATKRDAPQQQEQEQQEPEQQQQQQRRRKILGKKVF